jgi:hypothetical protein
MILAKKSTITAPSTEHYKIYFSLYAKEPKVKIKLLFVIFIITIFLIGNSAQLPNTHTDRGNLIESMNYSQQQRVEISKFFTCTLSLVISSQHRNDRSNNDTERQLY